MSERNEKYLETMAEIHEDLGQLDQLAEVRRRQELPPVRAALEEARILTMQGHLQEALESLEISIPKLNHPLLWNWKGEVLLRMERYEESLVALKRVLELNPRDESAYFTMARCFRELGLEEDHLSAMAKVVESCRGSHQTCPHYYYALQALGRHQEALVVAEAIVAENPKPGSYYHRSLAYVNVGLFEKAAEDIRTCLTYRPHSPVFRQMEDYIAGRLGETGA